RRAVPRFACPEPVLKRWQGRGKRLRRAALCQGAGAIAVLLVGGAAPAATPPNTAARIEELRRQSRMAQDLATSIAQDAATLDRAIGAPPLRAQLERSLNKQLSDDTLRLMASQARAEVDYWALYRRGIDRELGVERPEVEGRRAPGEPPPPDGV